MARQKYFTEEERLEARRKQLRESQRRWREANLEKDKGNKKRWREKNAEKVKENKKHWYQEYYKTPIGRAGYLVTGYQQLDNKYNRGECTLTAQWIVDNIFTSKCHWCKKTDWTKLGCDRIDNSKPHTPDNVVPCCEECNTKRGTKTYEEFLMSLKNEQPN